MTDKNLLKIIGLGTVIYLYAKSKETSASNFGWFGGLNLIFSIPIFDFRKLFNRGT